MEIVDSMISNLIEQLSTILTMQGQQANEFRHQLHDTRSKLSNIKFLLADNETSNRAQNLLPTFRDMMFEGDDIITDFFIRGENLKSGFFSNLSASYNIFYRRKAGRKIEDFNLRLQELKSILEDYCLKVPDAGGIRHQVDIDEQHGMGISFNIYEDSVNIYEDIVGFESDVEMIKKWIFGEIHMIGIVGMGGLGKTLIAKKIYNDYDVRGHFDRLIWVSISQSFSIEGILRTILKQLGAEISRGQSGTEMLNEIIVQLKDKSRCLIILDDLWDNDHLDWWKTFLSCLSKEISYGGRICIIITTRDTSIASAIRVDKMHQPRILDEEASWKLFCKHAFRKINEKNRLERFERVGKNIMAQCGGLPLAIKTLGALLGSEADSLSKWNEIQRNFCAPRITTANDVVMNSLKLSYNALPVHLKQCLLSFSVFPDDYEVQADRLIHWWIGEGLIQDTHSKTATELGFENLSKLVDRCLVEVVEMRSFDRKVYSCRLHNVIRILVLILAQNEGLCGFDDKGRQTAEDCRWLSFTSEMTRKLLNRSPKLRALLLMTNINEPFSQILGSLRTLDLSNNNLGDIALKNLLNWISTLKRLAYLNLSGTEGLKEVPNSIRKLRNLRILDLNGCINLSKLSPAITLLTMLKILDLNSCQNLPYLPRGLGRVSHLQELYGLRVSRGSNGRCCSLLEIAELHELRVLQMILGDHSQIKEEEWKALSQLEKLRILAVDFDMTKFERNRMFDLFSPPPSLHELYLRRYPFETLPKWVSPENLADLVYLCIEDGDLVDICAGETEWSIEGLRLQFLPNFDKKWKYLRKEMPLLRYAEVYHCPRIFEFPGAEINRRIWRLEDIDE